MPHLLKLPAVTGKAQQVQVGHLTLSPPSPFPAIPVPNSCTMDRLLLRVSFLKVVPAPQ